MDVAERQKLSEIALEIAQEAGRLVQEGYRAGVATEQKGGHADLVTEYDRRSEDLIRARLAERTPGIAVVGEEAGGEAGVEPTWFCDPIDGTTNFIHGHPFFCVSIGLLQGAEPLAGAIVAPALDTHWQGAVGGSALRDGKPCKVSDRKQLSDALVATGFHPMDRMKTGPGNNVEAFGRMLPRVRGMRRCGSAALDLCLTADGTYDAYWELGLNAWDTAAGAAIALAAGGRITDLSGGEPDVRVGHLLVSNGHVHGQLLDILRS